ncbi:MAG: nitronate monooxygenase [Deltaproteobacteria bacterium]|nr:nitronate monooxygenase [Deltaproteobacteria bacterium]
METTFTKIFGLRHPIMQSQMGGVSSPELVAAVSNAGGMGMLAAGGVPPELLRAQIEQVRALTDKPFGVNLLLPVLQPGQAEVCIEARVPLLSLFWGDPAPYVESAHRAGMKVIVQVGSVREAQAAVDAGADLIEAQGVEAGGHVRGGITTMVFTPLVVDAVRPVPVIAAGGIADGRGVAAVLALGAAGAALGTRFLASEESGALPEYKQRVVRASADDTVHTTLFDFGWPNAPHRALRNSVIDEWERAGRPPSGERPHEGEIIGELRLGELKIPVPRYASMPAGTGFTGEVEKTVLYAGQSCGLIRDVRPAADIVAQIAREAEETLRALTRPH